MDQNEYTIQMDKQIAFFRERRIPFVAYLWIETQTGLMGGALIRMDRFLPSWERPWKRKRNKHELGRAIIRLVNDPSKRVFIYQG